MNTTFSIEKKPIAEEGKQDGPIVLGNAPRPRCEKGTSVALVGKKRDVRQRRMAFD